MRFLAIIVVFLSTLFAFATAVHLPAPHPILAERTPEEPGSKQMLAARGFSLGTCFLPPIIVIYRPIIIVVRITIVIRIRLFRRELDGRDVATSIETSTQTLTQTLSTLITGPAEALVSYSPKTTTEIVTQTITAGSASLASATHTA